MPFWWIRFGHQSLMSFVILSVSKMVYVALISYLYHGWVGCLVTKFATVFMFYQYKVIATGVKLVVVGVYRTHVTPFYQ